MLAWCDHLDRGSVMTHRLFIRCYYHFRSINDCTANNHGEEEDQIWLEEKLQEHSNFLYCWPNWRCYHSTSLPSSVYVNTPVSNGKHSGDRLRVNTPVLPKGWSVAGGVDTAHTTLYKVQCSANGAAFMCSIVTHSDLTWTLTMGSTFIMPTQIPKSLMLFHAFSK